MPPKYRADDRLVTAEPKRPLGSRIPVPLHERVEQLCELAYKAGEARQPTKEQVVAAILLATPMDGVRLRDLLKAYGESTIADALPWLAEAGADVIDLPVRKSGPRSGASS